MRKPIDPKKRKDIIIKKETDDKKDDKIVKIKDDIPPAPKNILNIYQLPQNDGINILDLNEDPSFSRFMNEPLFKYGFYYYIHQTKNKMELFEKPQFKNKDLQKIVNAYEDVVPQEEFNKQFKTDKIVSTDDINSFSIKYFQVDKIISRAFYKLWELLMMFPLVKDKSSSFTSIHIAEAPGSFVQAVINYRSKFFTKEQTKDDKYIATSIDASYEKDNYIPAFGPDLSKNKQFSRWVHQNSDLTKIDVIQKFVADHKNSNADLITADGGFNWKDENYQEQEAYILLLSEIYCALKVQKEGGCFVIKFFEVFTEVTIKMIEILRRFYKNVLIAKPLLSRPSNSERYIVCINYNSPNEKYIEKIFNIINESAKRPDKFLVDIFPDYQITPAVDSIIKLADTQLSNEQHRQINDMVSYINEGNYFGDKYRLYLARRREANDFWISTFYPLSSKELANNRQMINILIDKTLENVKKTADDFSSKLRLVVFNTDSIVDEQKSSKVKSSKSKK
jgi:23S rRNA U2552 (ribose-2'-O)-methylase RlmE/FtsJ